MSTRYDDEPPMAAVWWEKFVNFAWRTDWTQVVLILGLSALGVVAIWSAGEFRQSGFWRSQIVFLVIGWLAYWVVASIDYRMFLRHARLIYLVGLLLLSLIHI
jgi:rod shape determining protein RodA